MKGKIFNSVSMKAPRRNVFDLSHEKKLSTKFGQLTPIYLEEVVPGDKFRVKTEHMIRLAPMLAPVMHRVNVYIHYFYVPMRIIWDGYENFFTGGKDGKTFPAMPVLTVGEGQKLDFAKGSLADYLGIPPPQSGTITDPAIINALPFRAYTQIYNDYYRDQNLTSEVPFSKGDVVDNLNIVALRKRAYERDYFTSALPDTQRGDDVLIPTEIKYSPIVTGAVTVGQNVIVGTDGPNKVLKEGTNDLQVENIESIGSTINDLRTSVRLQEFLERSMRGGARYVEHVLSFFGVKPNDSRMMRAEFLGGGKAPIVISEVLATFNNEDTDGATMYGHGMSASNSAGFKSFFPENGYVLGILSVIPRTTYQQGVEKIWLRRDRFDFFYPQFAHLGEEAILSKEIYHDYLGTAQDNDAVFGYTPRYSSYKYKPSTVHGDFRDALDFWHMGRKFVNRPLLVQAFIEANSSTMTRIFPDTTDNDKLYIQLYNDVKAIRPMPIFGTPKL